MVFICISLLSPASLTLGFEILMGFPNKVFSKSSFRFVDRRDQMNKVIQCFSALCNMWSTIKKKKKEKDWTRMGKENN